MWTGEVGALYRKASRLKNRGDFKGSLSVTEELLAKFERDDIRYAYILGCVKAVNLLHIGKRTEALDTFSKARKQAHRLRHWAIEAYITNDEASAYTSPEKSRAKFDQALALLRRATCTVDTERNLKADEAYFLASRAYYEASRGNMHPALETLKGQGELLGHFAYSTHPRYKGAYLVVLVWEFKVCGPERRLRLFLRIICEMLRQWFFRS